MTREEYAVIASSIPKQPGCYKYFDSSNQLLYIGKAKNLRKRTASYFSKALVSRKTQRLVAQIHRIEFTVTDSEHDAFLLENSLIKHFQPKYNISLKDDKTYPFIVIKKEDFPRVFFTRNIVRDGSEYIGPYTSVYNARELLDLIRRNIPLRTCKLNLSPKNVNSGRYKVCLEYHLGNCKGPCEGLQTKEDYDNSLEQVRYLLKGNVAEPIRQLKTEMMQHAQNLEFEKAAVLKSKIEALQQYESKSVIVNPHLGNLDIVSIINDEDKAYCNYMMLANGTIIHSKCFEIEKHLDETDEEILSHFIYSQRERYHSQAKEIIAPIPLEDIDAHLKLVIPKAGDKKKLLELSYKNTLLFKEELRKKKTLLLEEEGKQEQLNTLRLLQKELRMSKLPLHIECFDNSNFQGAFPVAAMVCFKNGIPFKSEYRRFHIKTVEGINDFASMSEIVYRRYNRLQEEGKSLPQLVIIDGGKGQLGAAMESIEKLGLTGEMTVVGLAKREESIFFPGRKEPLQIPFDNPAHLLIRRIRDEVHRFGITFHRETRSKGTIKNELENIPGIGEKTAIELLKEFKSVSRIKTLTERELTRIAGARKAAIIYTYFNP